jgi:hypothetical protein
MFGSRALGTERSDSDLDLFIDYNPASKIPSMFRLMQIEEQISKDLSGLSSPQGSPSRLRDGVPRKRGPMDTE